MPAVVGTWKKKRDDLKTKRDSLFDRYAKRPQDVHLALEIKTMDDEIAECIQHIEQETKSDRAASTANKVSTSQKPT